MKDKVWEFTYEGRFIRAVNRCSLFPPRTSDRLEVDGEVIDQNNGGFLRLFSVLRGTVDFAGVKRVVEARIAAKRNGLSTGCHIFVDDALVGGDKRRTLQIPDAELAQKQLKKGVLAYLVKTGFLLYGLPFAIGMTLFNQPDNLLIGSLIFVFYILFFGGIMGWLSWRSLKSQARRNEC